MHDAQGKGRKKPEPLSRAQVFPDSAQPYATVCLLIYLFTVYLFIYLFTVEGIIIHPNMSRGHYRISQGIRELVSYDLFYRIRVNTNATLRPNDLR